MAQPYTLKLGSVDLSNYIRLNADDGFDPYDQDGFDEPAFSGAPFAEGHPLTNVDSGNREMSWPMYLNAAPRTWAPTDIAGLVEWFSAQTITGNDGDAIGGAASWTGARGTTTSQPTAGSRPILKKNIVNGKQVVRFDGLNDALVTNLPSLGTQFTAVIVSTIGTNRILSSGSSSYRLGPLGATSMDAYSGIGCSWTVVAGGSFQINTWRLNGASSTGRRNGTNSSSGNQNPGANTWDANGFIGATDAGGGQAWGGDIAEILLFSGNLSDADIANLEGYFAQSSQYSLGFGTVPSPIGSAKDVLHALINSINREIQAPTSSPLRVEWKDQGATNSTFYDVTYARFDPNFNYRRGANSWLAGTLRIFCAPPYGHTGTERVIATAAGTQPNLTAPLIGVASPLVGDVSAQTRITVTMSGSQAPGPRGRGVIVAPVSASGYQAFIPAASLTELYPSAGIFGASGAPASQAIYRQSLAGALHNPPLAVAGLGATMYAGRRRVIAAVMPAICGPGMTVWAADPAGRAIGPTGAVYSNDGWQMVDLGVISVGTVNPTTAVTLYSGAIYKTGADLGQYMRPMPSGAAASSAFAIAGIYVMPEDTMVSVIDQSRPVARSFFGASGAATALYPSSFVGDLGETWKSMTTPVQNGIFNASGSFLTSASSNVNHINGVITGAGVLRNFRARAVIQPVSTGAQWNHGLTTVDLGGGPVPIALSWSITGSSFSCANLVSSVETLNNIASLVVASTTGCPYINATRAWIVDLVRNGNAVYANIRSSGTGFGFIPSAGMTPTIVPVACVGVASVGGLSLAPGLPWFACTVGSIVPLMSLEFDETFSVPLASEVYAITSVSGDTSRRMPISGSGPNVDISGVVRGPALTIVPSTVAIVAADWMIDGGPMNDINAIEVRVRERYRVAR